MKLYGAADIKLSLYIRSQAKYHKTMTVEVLRDDMLKDNWLLYDVQFKKWNYSWEYYCKLAIDNQHYVKRLIYKKKEVYE
jgi:hypothetical protein